MKDYVGARWLKCDFHLHTPASECFNDKTITADAWIQACLEQKLDCVAVTDHNTHAWIDQIKDAAEGKPIVVFPGVELTCDTSKVHLLVIFDKDKTGQDVYDFLISCGVRRDDFASSEAYSPLTCLEIIEKAKQQEAIVIPAHIDEFNGLGLLSKVVIKEFLEKEDILAAQFVNAEFKDPSLKIDEAYGHFYNEKYGRDEGSIGLQQIKDYKSCVQETLKHQISLVTFSDNPDSNEPSKHGLSGIGKMYTWIKMDKVPSLEGVRQALMIPERIKNCFDSVPEPYKEPSLWIKSIEVKGTTLTDGDTPFKISFNPQLNTIIGGRGSGKSSVFRFLRGAFKKINDIKSLQEIRDEQENFFQKPKDERGVLKDDTSIEIEFVRDGLSYKVVYLTNQGIKVYRLTDNQWEIVNEPAFISFFDFEQYTQKQVFAIAKNTNALRELIDTGNDEIEQLKREIEKLVQDYVSSYEKLKTVKGLKPRIEQLETEIRDFKQKIENLKNSNITAIAQKQVKFTKTHECIETYFAQIQKNLNQLSVSAKSSYFPVFNLDIFEEGYKEEILQLMQPLQQHSSEMIHQIESAIDDISLKMIKVYESMQNTRFEKDRLEHNEMYEKKKRELQERGIDDINNYQTYTEKLKVKEAEHKKLVEASAQIPLFEKRLEEIKNALYDRHAEISQKRQDEVNQLSTAKVKINVRRYSDSKKFLQQFREIIQKDRAYDGAFSIILKKCFPQNPMLFQTVYQSIVDDLHNIRTTGESTLGFDGWFIRMVRELDDEQMSRLETLIPDDQIDVLYKPNGSSKFRSIVSASAGQKTTAVLTYILSQGTIPLLLDQPEDDLDNRLVCDLVVDKIKHIKENRQVIVITHNANIPVIGDAEYIVSMDSNTPYLTIHTEGMLESTDVKKEICEIMEGGEDAFKLRAMRYKTIFK